MRIHLQKTLYIQIDKNVMTNTYNDFVSSLEDNVSSDIFDLEDETLLAIACFFIAANVVHEQPHHLYCACAALYILLERYDEQEPSIWIDGDENSNIVYALGVMGDVVMSFIDDKRDFLNFPIWPDYVNTVLCILLGHKNYKLSTFEYNPVSSRGLLNQGG